MQTATLSPQQRHALESTYTFFRGVTAFLESLDSAALQLDDRLTVANLRELAASCEHKLLEGFPELHSWLAEWTRGGVR